MPSTLESNNVSAAPRILELPRLGAAPSPADRHQNSDTILFLIAVICPPLAVLSLPGITSADVTTNVFLTLLGWLPGGPSPKLASVRAVSDSAPKWQKHGT